MIGESETGMSSIIAKIHFYHGFAADSYMTGRRHRFDTINSALKG